MSDYYVGEIRMFAGSRVPSGWSFCNGATLQVSANQLLFAVIGTTYGGDGVSTFMLPNLQGRIPLGMGQGPGLTNRNLAEQDGVEAVTLTTDQIPAHTHALIASTVLGTSLEPSGRILASTTNVTVDGAPLYTFGAPPVDPAVPFTLNGGAVESAGGNLPHANIMPSFCVNFIIALGGIYPSPAN